MITCTPRGICSTDYVLRFDKREAHVTFRSLSEQGAISIGEDEYEIHKDSILKSHWRLEREGQTVAQAYKPSMWKEGMIVEVGGVEIVLQKSGFWSTSIQMVLADQVVAEVRKVHAFTNRATIEGRTDELPFEVISFAFWLVSAMWKRAAAAASV